MNNIEVNPNKEYILAGDISGSMSTPDPKCANQSRFNYMLEKFEAFVKIACDYDPHGGPTVLLFGENVYKFEHTNLEVINSKLRTVKLENMTMTDEMLREAFDEHNEEKEELRKEDKQHPGTICMVFTDGQPTNEQAVIREVTRIANSISRDDEFQIVFLTVGTIDLRLYQFLKQLENIKSKIGMRSIVQVKELSDVNFLAAVA